MIKQNSDYTSSKKAILKKSKKDELKLKLEDGGWYYIEENANVYEHKFDLVAETRYFIGRKWHLLVLFVDKVDNSNLNIFHKQYHEIYKKFNKTRDECFVYCVIARQIDPSIKKRGQWKILSSGRRRPRGGGIVFFLDLNNGKNYGNIVTIPWDAGRYSKEISGLLNWLIKEKKKNYYKDDYSVDYALPYRKLTFSAYMLLTFSVNFTIVALILFFVMVDENPLFSIGCVVFIIANIYLITKIHKKYSGMPEPLKI